MKSFISFTVFILLVTSCNKSETKTKIEKNNSISKVEIDSHFALKFINDYAELCNTKSSSKDTINITDWIEKNNLVTDNFKVIYKNLIDAAEKEDPEMGLDFDPIFDAQDLPDKGFELSKIDKSGYIIVKGKDWDEFQLPIKVIFKDNKWIVDGAGIVNIPKEKQIKKI